MAYPAQAGPLEQTLDILASARNLNQWVFDELRSYIGQSILEIGAGTGNITEWLAQLPGRTVYATDIDPLFHRILSDRFRDMPQIHVLPHDACQPFMAPNGRPTDTIICVNVLEHLEDDREALRAFWESLIPKGHLLILVPALPWLYGTIDRAIGHFRRYTRKELADKVSSSGFQILSLEAFNLLGVLGWWWQGRILRRTSLDARQVRLFDEMVPLLRRIPGLNKGPLGISWLLKAQRMP